jgi:hypothetical protein
VRTGLDFGRESCRFAVVFAKPYKLGIGPSFYHFLGYSLGTVRVSAAVIAAENHPVFLNGKKRVYGAEKILKKFT